jgi:threonyl-tRNA synthetase
LKIPYTLVIGDEEVSNNTVTIRRFGSRDTAAKSVDQFEKDLLADIASHSRALDTLEKAVKGE